MYALRVTTKYAPERDKPRVCGIYLKVPSSELIFISNIHRDEKKSIEIRVICPLSEKKKTCIHYKYIFNCPRRLYCDTYILSRHFPPMTNTHR